MRTLLLLAVCLLLAVPARAQTGASEPSEPSKKSLRDRLTDDEDGRFDLSELMESDSNSKALPIPIPILITEPAVGYGGGFAPVWFHGPPDRSSGQLVPPSVTVAAGMLTSDGSWVAGGGHFHSFKKDTWRVAGFAGRAALELESAGIAPDFGADQSVEYSIDATFLLLEASRRLSPRTHLGFRYIYADTEVAVGDPSAHSLSGTTALGGLGLFLGFDSRDNILSPMKGQRVELRPTYYGETFGGDVDFLRVDTLYTGYWNRGPLGFALRLDADWIEDGAPFYAKPFITLRGVPAMAFLGQEVLSAESEIDWNLNFRWTLLAFAGAGRATNDVPLRCTVDRDVYAGGAGFRYLLARVLGLRAGLDFARSSEGDHAFYIVIGSAWH
jgi:hypothetical protein